MIMHRDNFVVELVEKSYEIVDSDNDFTYFARETRPYRTNVDLSRKEEGKWNFQGFVDDKDLFDRLDILVPETMRREFTNYDTELLEQVHGEFADLMETNCASELNPRIVDALAIKNLRIKAI